MVEPRIAGHVRVHRAEPVTLLAGQVYFGKQAASVRTLLGSCVAITLWHPQQQVGGMCHFLLPDRGRGQPDAGPDARYGADAFAWLLSSVKRSGAAPREYVTGLYGGADTMPDRAGVKFDIGQRNVELAWGLLEEHGFELHEIDVGDHVPRNLHLDLTTGAVTLRRGTPHRAAA